MLGEGFAAVAVRSFLSTLHLVARSDSKAVKVFGTTDDAVAWVETNLLDPPCAPDLNGDGIVDNGDIVAFIALFIGGDPGADFNGDGFLDNGDIGAFINLFVAGC